WGKLVAFVKPLMPSVLYFPNFLFEFPDKIYLEQGPTEEEKHSFYRKVIQDVLDSIGEGANIETHILDRARDTDSFARTTLDSMLLGMGTNITKTVFSNWNRIFKRPMGRKEVVVTIHQDEEGNRAWYLRLRLKDGGSSYAISDRSLGF